MGCTCGSQSGRTLGCILGKLGVSVLLILDIMLLIGPLNSINEALGSPGPSGIDLVDNKSRFASTLVSKYFSLCLL